MLRYGLLTASGRDGGRAGVKVELGCAAAVKIKLPNAPSNDRNIFDDTHHTLHTLARATCQLS